jgi:hypothetical protein
MGISDPLYGAVPDITSSVISIREDCPPSAIVLHTGSLEMLRVAKDGFYVRGEKVPVDDKEAETVYNAFLQWMSYMALTRNY